MVGGNNEYPTGYAAYRRILSTKIRDKIRAVRQQTEDYEERELLLKEYAMRLSSDSGAALSLLDDLFILEGVRLNLRAHKQKLRGEQ